MGVQGRTQPTALDEQRCRVGPGPSVCIGVHLWFHCLACLAACRTLPQGLADRDPRQDPIHLCSYPADSCAVARPTPVQLPGRRCPPSRSACNETMVRLARDCSGYVNYSDVRC
jgi:hypothetical protein